MSWQRPLLVLLLTDSAITHDKIQTWKPVWMWIPSHAVRIDNNPCLPMDSHAAQRPVPAPAHAHPMPPSEFHVPFTEPISESVPTSQRVIHFSNKLSGASQRRAIGRFAVGDLNDKTCLGFCVMLPMTN
ncbi:hypothetical protein F4779DRAFT_613384 [Xylariaceae sp. FL0662B]|nr:hypothetical protein F4779DRAFT_613384 [Xylariaceae sp. FL0662B]